jgi:hypothetical protein
MTWKEIKKAVDDADISEEDEVSVIECQPRDGNKTLRKMKLGKFVKLAENFSEEARKRASGCTC